MVLRTRRTSECGFDPPLALIPSALSELFTSEEQQHDKVLLEAIGNALATAVAANDEVRPFSSLR